MSYAEQWPVEIDTVVEAGSQEQKPPKRPTSMFYGSREMREAQERLTMSRLYVPLGESAVYLTLDLRPIQPAAEL